MVFFLQIVLIVACLFYGARKGGVALGLLGGTELMLAPGEPSVWVVSPSSPVGRALIGRSVGDEVKIARAGAMRHYDIVAIS